MTTYKKRIVLASGNQGKIKELEAILTMLPLEVLPQSHYQIADVDETGLTFVENALLKARNACAITKLPAIADDSGICIQALNKAPGIYSARYAGPMASSKDRIAKVLHEMEGIPIDQRQAHFYCVIVYLEHEKDPTPLIAHGVWEGIILEKPKGEQGFGYDPIFFDPNYQCTAAELTPDLKNKISHRGKALIELIRLLTQKTASGFLPKNNP